MTDSTSQTAPVSSPSTDPEGTDPEGPTGGSGDELAWLVEPAKDLRETVVSMRVTEAERDRIARAAAAAGSTPSAYARSRVLNPGPDVDAWRAVYRLVLRVREAAERGDDPVETARQVEAEFREIALTVLPADDAK